MTYQPIKALALKVGEFWVQSTLTKYVVSRRFYELTSVTKTAVHFRSLDHREILSMSISDVLNYRVQFSDELNESVGVEWVPIYHAEPHVQRQFFSEQQSLKRPIELGGREAESIPGPEGWLGRDQSTWEQVIASWGELLWYQKIMTVVFAAGVIYILTQFLYI